MDNHRISRLRNLIYQVQENAQKMQRGTRSERAAADAGNMDMVSKLCDALDEALTELEKKS